MIFEEIREIKSGQGELRKFGISMAVGLSVVGSLLLWRHKGHPRILFAVAVTALALALTRPNILKPLHKAVMSLAVVLAWFLSQTIVVIFFYAVLTPFAFAAKLAGKDFLDRKLDKGRKSYWIEQDPKIPDPSEYENQF